MSSKIVDLPRFDTGNLRHDAWNRLQILNNLVESGRRNVADTYLRVSARLNKRTWLRY